MATADIDWTALTGSGTIADGGYVGDLMTISRAHIDEALATNQITQEQSGEVYTAMIATSIQQAMAFLLKEQLTEAQIDKAEADAAIAAEQLEIAKSQASREYVLTIAEVDKNYGYNYTLDADYMIDITSLNDAGDGKMDADVALAEAQVKLTNRKVL